MATITCTRCGLRGSDADAFCTRCGISRTGDASHAPRPGSGSGSRAGMWIAVAAVCGFGGIVVVSILAAIAIPKFASVSAQAKAAEAPPILKYIHSLQQLHHEQHGRYAANLDDPAAPDFLAGYDPPEARYFVFSVSHATGDALCIEAHPSAEGEAAGLEPVSMDGAGVRYVGAGCTEPAPTAEEEWESRMEEIVSDSEARPVLARVHRLQKQAHERNGRFTSDLAELEGAEELDNRFFTFSVLRATERELCVEARLTPAGRAAGLAETSIDETGQVYLGNGCTGTRMTRDDDTVDREWQGAPDPDEAARDSIPGNMLKALHIIQTLFHEDHGRYARDIRDLPFEGDVNNHFFTFAVSRASEDALCLEARPTPAGRAAGLTGSSMDEKRNSFLGLGCTGAPIHPDGAPGQKP